MRRGSSVTRTRLDHGLMALAAVVCGICEIRPDAVIRLMRRMLKVRFVRHVNKSIR